MTDRRGDGGRDDDRAPQPPVFQWSADDLEDPLLRPVPGLEWTSGQPSASHATPARVAAHPLTAWSEPIAAPGNGFATEPAPAVPERRRRSGMLAIISVVAATAGALGAGACVWASLSSISFVANDPVGNALHWLSLALVMALVVFASVVLALVAIARRKRWPLGLLAIAVALVLTPVSVAIGFQEGLNEVGHKAQVVAPRLADYSGSQIADLLESNGVELGPFRDWLASQGEGDSAQ